MQSARDLGWVGRFEEQLQRLDQVGPRSFDGIALARDIQLGAQGHIRVALAFDNRGELPGGLHGQIVAHRYRDGCQTASNAGKEANGDEQNQLEALTERKGDTRILWRLFASISASSLTVAVLDAYGFSQLAFVCLRPTAFAAFAGAMSLAMTRKRSIRRVVLIGYPNGYHPEFGLFADLSTAPRSSHNGWR